MYSKYSRNSKTNKKRKNYYNYNQSRYNSKKNTKVKKDRFLNIMIFLVIIAISYVSMDMFDVKLPSSLTSKISEVFNSEFLSFGETKDKVVSFVNNTASVFNGEKSSVNSSSNALKLEMPVNGEVITTFEDTTHPVFNTTVKPRGIEIQTSKSEEVFASIGGVVSNIVSSSYGGSRVVFDVGNDTTVVYDGVKSTFVKVGDNVKIGDLIGSMGSEESGDVLGFEVGVDNTAVDPISYMDIDDNKENEK